MGCLYCRDQAWVVSNMGKEKRYCMTEEECCISAYIERDNW